MRPRLGAAASVVLVAALATACGTQPGSGDTAPAPLHLTDTGTGSRALGVPEPAYGGTPTGSPYVLRTTLPSSTPAPAAVWRWQKPSAADAARVAAALGVKAAPTEVDGGRVARSGSHLLTVRDDGSWTWGLDCMPGVPIERESLQVACGSAVTTPAAPGPTAARARQLADPILGGLGWSAGDITVAAGSPTTTVTARKSVSGTDTADWLTTLSFTVGGLLDTANGWAVEPVRGREYPLVDAATAFRILLEQPRPMPLLCRVRSDGKPGCEPVTPRIVTGARLGLALRHEPDRALLVPAWLFDLAGGGDPPAVVAVAPQFLATPTPAPMGTPATGRK
jgi:hypothetical protein